jgi:hypothetical protein
MVLRDALREDRAPTLSLEYTFWSQLDQTWTLIRLPHEEPEYGEPHQLSVSVSVSATCSGPCRRPPPPFPHSTAQGKGARGAVAGGVPSRGGRTARTD